MSVGIAIAVAIISGVVAFGVGVALTQFLRRGAPAPDVSAPLMAVAQGVGDMKSELTRLAERVSNVEGKQDRVGVDIGTLKTDLVKTGDVTDTIRTVAHDVRDKVLKAQETIGELRTQLQERKDSDDRIASAVQHIETVIAGSATKGGAGESIIEGMLAEIPAEWRVNNYRVGNKVVEFGLKLPNGLVLPIDSKWAATGLVEELEKCDDPPRREELKEEIGSVVEKKARELNKYLDPNFTANFGIAVVPDAVLGACVRKQVDLLKYSVVLVGYSMFVPYLLLVIQTMMKYSKQIDQQKVHNFIQNAEGAVEALRKELDGSFSRALAMLGNSRDELKNQAARLANELSAIQMIAESSQVK